MKQNGETVEVLQDVYVRTSVHAAVLLAILSKQAQDGVLTMTVDIMHHHASKYPMYRSHRRVRMLIKSLEHAGYMVPVEKSGKTVTAWKINTSAVVENNGSNQ